jgi:hypothetical protein
MYYSWTFPLVSLFMPRLGLVLLAFLLLGITPGTLFAPRWSAMAWSTSARTMASSTRSTRRRGPGSGVSRRATNCRLRPGSATAWSTSVASATTRSTRSMPRQAHWSGRSIPRSPVGFAPRRSSPMACSTLPPLARASTTTTGRVPSMPSMPALAPMCGAGMPCKGRVFRPSYGQQWPSNNFNSATPDCCT